MHFVGAGRSATYSIFSLNRSIKVPRHNNCMVCCRRCVKYPLTFLIEHLPMFLLSRVRRAVHAYHVQGV